MIRAAWVFVSLVAIAGIAVGARGMKNICECAPSDGAILSTDTANKTARQCGPLRCSLKPAGMEDRIAEFDAHLRPKVLETRELDDGYALRFDADRETLLALADWIAKESQCCSFLDYQLNVQKAGGPIWFRMNGSAEAKDFLRPLLVKEELLPRAQ